MPHWNQGPRQEAPAQPEDLAMKSERELPSAVNFWHPPRAAAIQGRLAAACAAGFLALWSAIVAAQAPVEAPAEMIAAGKALFEKQFVAGESRGPRGGGRGPGVKKR